MLTGTVLGPLASPSGRESHWVGGKKISLGVVTGYGNSIRLPMGERGCQRTVANGEIRRHRSHINKCHRNILTIYVLMGQDEVVYATFGPHRFRHPSTSQESSSALTWWFALHYIYNGSLSLGCLEVLPNNPVRRRETAAIPIARSYNVWSI